MRQKGIQSVCSPASQVSSHVGAAGVGVIGLRGAPVTLPASATSQFQRFYDSGWALRCVLPVGGRVMHMVVIDGYQGADKDSEQLGLTNDRFRCCFM